MKLLRITTDLELTEHEFPVGSYMKQNKELRELIGNRCDLVERVSPRRLYTELHHTNQPTGISGQAVSMLVDEEGRLKEYLDVNAVGSYLYETDIHNQPIMGSILFIGEEWDFDGIAFCGIEEATFKKLKSQMEDLIALIGRR